MKSFIVSSIYVTLLLTLLVTAVPVPVVKGDLVTYKPASADSDGRHRGIALESPDRDGNFPVTAFGIKLNPDVFPYQAKGTEFHPHLDKYHIDTGRITHEVLNTGSVKHFKLYNKYAPPMDLHMVDALNKRISKNQLVESLSDLKSCLVLPQDGGSCHTQGGHVIKPAVRVAGRRRSTSIHIQQTQQWRGRTLEKVKPVPRRRHSVR